MEYADIFDEEIFDKEMNDFLKSKESLNKAIIADPKMGKAYIFLAQQYANSANNCGKNELEKKEKVIEGKKKEFNY